MASSSFSSSLVLAVLAMVCSSAYSQTCQVPACCNYEKYLNSDMVNEEPTCSQVQSYCVNRAPGCNEATVTYVAIELQASPSSSSSAKNSSTPLTSGEKGLIAVGVLLVVGIVIAIGVSSRNHYSKMDFPKDQQEDLMEGATRSNDRTSILTTMTAVSCIVAVIALVVAIIAVTDKPAAPSSSNPASSSNGDNLEVMPSSLDQMQLRTGPYRLKLNSMISSHPFCQQNLTYWGACQELTSDLERMVNAVGNEELSVNQTMDRVSSGEFGDKSFVAFNNTFTAVSPSLKKLSTKLFQTHPLANTDVCDTFTPKNKLVCLVQHRCPETNVSMLAAYIQPNPESSIRSRRHGFGSRLSKNWHGSWDGAAHAVEQGAIHGAESGAWHGAIKGAIAGIAGGPAGVVGGALTGAAEGAAQGAIHGGISGGEHYVEDQAASDVEQSFADDDDDGF